MTGAAYSSMLGVVRASAGRFIGMTGTGASAPAPQLYEHFGITAEAIAAAARAMQKAA